VLILKAMMTSGSEAKGRITQRDCFPVYKERKLQGAK